MRLILVRHALPERVTGGQGRSEGRADGRADPGLTELGRRQAVRVAEALAGETVTAVRTSPMRRARDTAAPLAAALGLTAEVVPDLVEFDVDQPNYIPIHEMATVDPESYARLRAGQLPAHVDVPAFRARVTAAVDGLVDALEPRDTAVCFAHAGVINVYLAALLGIDRPLPFPLDYTGITRVSVSRSGGARVRTINEIGHVAELLNPGSAP